MKYLAQCLADLATFSFWDSALSSQLGWWELGETLLCSPSKNCGLGTLCGLLTALTLFVCSFSGITVLCSWCPVFHIFCRVISLFCAGWKI